MRKKLLSSQIDYYGVHLNFDNGQTHYIAFNNYSGKLIQCDKKALTITVEHTGVYLGKDQTGKEWVVHNHPKYREASIVTMEEFAQKRSVSLTPIACVNPPNVVIDRSLEHVKRRTPYRLLQSNCQHLTSDSCNNKPVSQDLEKWSNTAKNIGAGLVIGAGVSLLALLLVKLFEGSRPA